MSFITLRRTDDEYIENLRRKYKRRRFSFILSLFTSIFIMAISYLGGRHIDGMRKNMLDEMKKSKNNADRVVNNDISIVSGILSYRAGFLVGQGITAGAFGLLLSLSFALSWRKDALLLKYYDERNNKD